MCDDDSDDDSDHVCEMCGLFRCVCGESAYDDWELGYDDCFPNLSHAKEGATAMVEIRAIASPAPPSGTLVEPASEGNAGAGRNSIRFAASINLAEHPVRPSGPHL